MTQHRYHSLTVSRILVTMLVLMLAVNIACERDPELHLHRGGPIEVEIPDVDLELEAYWDYEFEYGITYDWRAEWIYGWDSVDIENWGVLGYVEPSVFCLRRYYTKKVPNGKHTNVQANTVYGTRFHGAFDFGYWDILVWNDDAALGGVQTLNFDEERSLDSVTAYTNMSMNSSRYQAPKYTRAFYQPEPLFAAYVTAVEISENLDGFVYDSLRNVYVKHLEMKLEPITYIYLTQVILHNNRGRVVNVDGNADLSGMARSVNLNTGITGGDAVTIYYNTRFKRNIVDARPGVPSEGELVDVAGGRLMTFGMCGVNANRLPVNQAYNDGRKHYMDLNLQFNNGLDSLFVFDVTDRVQRLFKGGVITVELDMDTVRIPTRSGGSAFDAVVMDYEDGGTHVFEM